MIFAQIFLLFFFFLQCCLAVQSRNQHRKVQQQIRIVPQDVEASIATGANSKFHWNQLPDNCKIIIINKLRHPVDLAHFASSCKENKNAIFLLHSNRLLTDAERLRRKTSIKVSEKFIRFLYGSKETLEEADWKMVSMTNNYQVDKSFRQSAAEFMRLRVIFKFSSLVSLTTNTENQADTASSSYRSIPFFVVPLVTSTGEHRTLFLGPDFDQIFRIYASLRNSNVGGAMQVYERVQSAQESVSGFVMSHVDEPSFYKNGFYDIPSMLRAFRSSLEFYQEAQTAIGLNYLLNSYCAANGRFFCHTPDNCHFFAPPGCFSTYEQTQRPFFHGPLAILFSWIHRLTPMPHTKVPNRFHVHALVLFDLVCRSMSEKKKNRLDWEWVSEDEQTRYHCREKVFEPGIYTCSTAQLLAHPIFSLPL
jgi:hypothetical protein